MALKGSLKDFSLPDLFQLLNFSKKNGTLNLLRGNARGYVCFRNGEVFFATTNWKRKPLGVKLLQAGIVTKAQVDESLELQRTTARGQRLGQLLIRLGYLTKDKLEVFVQEQIQDAVFELLRWTEGEFEFQPGVVFPEEDIGLSISTEELIMEGSRRLDEWNRIEKKIPDLDVIFKMKSMQERVAAQISLTPEEWMVLTFIDGERTVKDIVDLTAMGTLQTCKIVYGLIASGLLENVSPDVSDVKVEQELERMAEELMQLDEMVIERPGFVAREELVPVDEVEEASVLSVAPLTEAVPPQEEVSLGEEVSLAEEVLAASEVAAPVVEAVEEIVEEAEEVVELEEMAEEVTQAETIEREREKEEEASESLEVEIEEDMEGEILIEEIFSDDETIGIEEVEEVEEIEELGVEIAEDLLAEEETAEVPVAEAAPVEETPLAAELEDLVAEAAEQVVKIEMEEAPGRIAEAEEPPSQPVSEPLVLDAVEELEAEMLSGVLDVEEDIVTFEAVEEPAVEVPLEGVVEPPGAGEEVRRGLEAEAASMVSEMRDLTLEESQDATSEIELGEKEEELAMLKEKIISLLPEGMGLAEEEKVEGPAEEPLFEGKEPPSYRHKTMTDESIEAQAAKSAYLEKRYGKVGKLADQGDMAGMEPDEIPLEWSGHLERTSHQQEVSAMPGGLMEEEEEPEKAEAAGRAIDPTKILGAAFRGGELKEEESESLGLEERIVDLNRQPTGTLSIEDLVKGVRQETGADMTETIRSRIEEMEASVAMAERMAPEQVEGRSEEVDMHDRAGVAEELEEARRAVGFTPARDSVELLEEEMLEDYTAEGQMLEEAVPPKVAAEEAVTVEEEAAMAEASMSPAMDDTFLRIEELELDMLEEVIEEDLVGVEPAPTDMATVPLEEALQLEEAASPVEEAMIPAEVSAAAGSVQTRPMNVSELEDDMLVDYIAGEGGTAVSAAREEEQSLVLEEMEGLEDDLAALEKELFAGEEVALEEDILTDIEEIEKSISQEEAVEPEAPVEPAAPPFALFEPPPAEPVEPPAAFVETPPVEVAAPPASELDMLERIIEAPEPPPAEPVEPPAAFIAPEPPMPAAAPLASELDMLERIIEMPEVVEEAPAPAAAPLASELDMLERIIEMPEVVEEAPAPPAAPLASELDMLERIIEMPEVVEEAPAPPAAPLASELDMLERIIEAPEPPPAEPVEPPAAFIVPEPPMPAAAPLASELDMLERIIEAPEPPPAEPVEPPAAFIAPEPPMPAAAPLASELDMLERIIEAPEPPPAEPVEPPAAFIVPEPPMPAAAPLASELDMLERIIEAPEPPPAEPVEPPAAFIAPEPPMPAAAPLVPPAAKTFEVIEEPLPKILEEPEMGVAAPAAPQAASPPEEKAYPAPQEAFDTGSYTLERELAELTGAGAPQPTRKIKIPVKPGKEGESPMQEMAKGKPVPKVKRDKTVTKGIIVRIIDGIKKL